MEEDNKLKLDKSQRRWLVIVAFACVMFWIKFRSLHTNAVNRIWKYFEVRFLDKFQAKYNDKMQSRKKALLFDGLTQMAKDAGRPVHVLEIGSGTGANFAYYLEGTTVSCLDPVPQFNEKMTQNASHFPLIHLGELHRGFAEDMSVIKSGSNDAVVSKLMMCSVRNIDKCMQEILRVLRPVGIAFSIWKDYIIGTLQHNWLVTIPVTESAALIVFR